MIPIRPAALTAALALTGGLLVAAPALTVPAQAAPTAADPPTLSSNELTVTVGADFPRVIRYADNASGKTLGGQPDAISTITINGTARTAHLAGPPTITSSRASYKLAFDALPGVELDAGLAVTGRVTTFSIDAIRDTETSRVNTIDIPDHDLVSVASTDAGATTAFTTLDPDSTRTADKISPVTPTTPAEPAATGAAYALVNTNELAAGIESNSVYDKPSGQSVDDGARFWHRARKAADGTSRVGVWSGQWTYRADTSPYTEPLPWAKVVVTPDANDDKTVDWQDGAIAFRSIMTEPKGGDQVKNRVVTHIPFNFASQATHPFLRTLDDVKRISLATDGLGQMALLKGYGSEGHDSAHPDYGGNYNIRAGGLADLNTLLKKGKDWNAAFGVHVNATESYPEANAFSEDLVDKSSKGWNWLNQSYYIKQRPDLATGNIVKRFQQLRDETDQNLQELYIDVYYQSGWLADGLTRQLADQGWQVATEWADRHERTSLWSHWANDLDYGGATNKGLNSKIIRFVRNHEKDVWNADPILGQSSIVEFEGWTSETDWNKFYANVWQRNLPAKFLQQQQISDWNPNEIAFTGGVRGTVENGKRSLYVGAAKVLDGDKYLLPWDNDKKLYHYNPEGGPTAWQVPAALASTSKFTVYKLTDTGRVKVTTAPVRKGVVTLNAEPGQPYVLYPDQAPAPQAANWGEGSHLKDPGFNAGDLKAWSPTGSAKLDTLANGQHVAVLGPEQTALKQVITGLTNGRTYSASAWIEVEPGKSRRTTISVNGVNTSLSRSTAQNKVASDDKQDLYYQRARVLFDATGSTADLSIGAAAGNTKVRIDDVRVVETKRPSAGLVDDFENVDQGWGPFVKGDAGGTTDPRTSLLKKHAPYTQAGWNGKLVDDVLDGDWSLKSHEENEGLVYRTAPWTVDFKPGHKYKVSFDYESGQAGQYTWVQGVDRPQSVEVKSTPIGAQRTKATFDQEFVAGCGGDYWVGLRKLSSGGDQADFIMDNFAVTDLGASSEAADCTSLSLSGAGLNGMVSGEANTVVTTFANNDVVAVSNITLALTAPTGWTVEATTPATHPTVAAGTSVITTWNVTPPAGTPEGKYVLTATGGTATTTAEATLLPPGIVPQSRIKVADVSSEDVATGGPATAALDGNPSTLWHSAWSEVSTPATYPHHITLDLGTTYQVDGFGYLPRQSGTNGMFKGYEIYVSTDGQDWGAPVKTGEFPNSIAVQRVDFPAKAGRYVKFVGTSSLNGAVFGSAAELNVYGTR
ncbi:endo-alpha-N-acetylgalactosaminidase [Kribbella orskensis]|uniref:Endo-alpha-N-acetylgalactosaminidase n=1 Tax=Kribbella orskensis TaxID=2512216 RepID=A0ABY2BUG7_9ACTN|nr:MULTISPECIES: endo-alpha-N-acetylgalactosaminidase family protein [Kribbella]TCN44513.1 endo-alpha-N-acetylgalactosaminidase [Kribbella sp. VKM Ac-2500]TCO31709.1 endo-alpha-N-acetylgalactosaminidase [Kribbella orskensis]